jgi:uncharacterized membrane protein
MEPTNEQPSGPHSDAKIFMVLGYIIPIFFFIPLLNEKWNSIPMVRFHANQQAVLLGAYLLVTLAAQFLVTIYVQWLLQLLQLANIGVFILSLYGVYYAYKDQMKELPLIGHFRLLK